MIKTFVAPLALLSLFFAFDAQASYVMSCSLTGTVMTAPDVMRQYLTSPQGEIEREISTFQFAVHKAAPNGRADGDCAKTFQGQSISVTLNAGIQKVKAIQKGDRITIHYLVKDGDGAPRRDDPVEIFSLP